MSKNRRVRKDEVLDALKTIKQFCKEQHKFSDCQYCPLRDLNNCCCQLVRDGDSFMEPRIWEVNGSNELWLNGSDCMIWEESEEE